MQYEIRAIKGTEGIVRLALDAADEAAARDQARAQGFTVLSARPRGLLAGFVPSWRRGFPLLLFSQELLALLSAGLSLAEVFDTMVAKETRADSRKLLAGVRDRLFEGRSLSAALGEAPQAFPPLFVATVRAAERTGDLPEALARYIAYHERLDLVKKKIASASIYPVVLLFVGGLVTLFLLGYVVPRFAGIYDEVGRDLPFLSRLLIEWGKALNAHGGLIAAAVVALLAAAIALRARGARLFGAGLARVPAIGARLRVYHLARFYRTVGMLLRGGTPLVAALGMVAGLLPPELRERLAHASARIREGASISTAMDECGLATPVASRMLRVGEKSGDMAEMMERVAVFHDEELARWIEWFTRLFEPLLMALIGVVIGAIVILMYLPVFELAGSLQ
jgi:general secretion pathway protein F